MMYEYMTRKLQAICPKLLVIQEGGYNIDYLGQHALGVVNGLQAHSSLLSPTPADIDGGLKAGKSIDEQIDTQSAKVWAKANVEETRKFQSGLWKAAP